MPTFESVGKATPLLDGKAKVTGATRFAPDIFLPGMLHARLVTSPYAHANIRHIDRNQALSIPGVVAVLTAEDLPPVVPTGRIQLLLARGRVIFSGQPVALVLATSEAAAVDGLEQVHVDYEPLPSATTMDAALAPDAPLVWPDGLPGTSDIAEAHGTSLQAETFIGQTRSNVASHNIMTRGDIERGFTEADVTVERTFTNPAVHQSAIEPQAMLVQPDPETGGVTVWSSTQATFALRDDLSDILGLPASNIRVIGMPVGGGFGSKISLYEPLIALAAVQVQRPVKLVLTRQEELLAANPAPAMKIHLKLGARQNGALTALQAEIEMDDGCYPSWIGGAAGFLLGSLYRLPNFTIEVTDVLTFKPSVGSYRAPGAVPADFALESLIDEIADNLDLDPIELRLLNASRSSDLMANDEPWPSIGMIEVLQSLRQHPAWQQRDQARQRGRGIGIAIGGWTGASEPTSAACRVDRDGKISIHIGSADLSGTATSFALMAAQVFGVSVDQIGIKIEDTDHAPYAGGSYGSKTTYSVGPAVIAAANEARSRLLSIAAEEFEADPADLEIIDGVIQVRGVPHRSVTIRSIAEKTMNLSSKYAPVVAYGSHSERAKSPGFCAQLAEIEVEPETGSIKVHRLVIVQDAGRAINPAAVQGQMTGGATQGLGWAIYEGLIYGEQGELLTGSWMDYAVPKSTQAAGVYETVIVEVPTDTGPFGARGVGEPPIIATAAAIANALADCTGVRLTDLPMTAPRVYEALSKRWNQAPR